MLGFGQFAFFQICLHRLIHRFGNFWRLREFNLLAFLGLVGICSSTFATIVPIPDTPQCHVQAGNGVVYVDSSCQTAAERHRPSIASANRAILNLSCDIAYPASSPCSFTVITTWGAEITYGFFAFWSTPLTCPAHSTLDGPNCICDVGYVEQAGMCVLPETTINLTGPSATKALPAGPALLETATVTQSGTPKPGVSVTITLTGHGAISGTTDAAGQFNFTYVPPRLIAASDELIGTCAGCSNTAVKPIKVEPCDICEGKVGNPISIATGEKDQTEADWQDNGTHPLSFTRHYRSYANIESGLGARWSHNWAAAVTKTDLQATVRFGDGSKSIFNRTSPTATWVADNGKDLLADNPSAGAGFVTFTRASDETRWQFRADGKLLGVTQRNGWTMALAYNAAGQLASVTNAFGRSLQFTYDTAGKLTSVTTPDARLFTYGYDSAARLLVATYPGTTATTRVYAYEDTRWPNALTGITDEQGVRYATFAYDAAGRATTTQHAGSTQTYSVAYPSGAVASTGSLTAGSTVSPSIYQSTSQVTDPLGNLQTYTFQGGDGQVRLLGLNGAFEGAQVAARSFGLGATTLPSSETDFLGTQTTFAWDTTRRLLLTTTKAANKPEAQASSTQWHPTFRLPVLVTEPGRTTATTYDALGNKLTETVTDTTGTATNGQTRNWAWSYNAQSLMVSATDPRGQVTQYTYDSAGNVATMRNALNQTTAFTYDGAGRTLTQTDPNGLVTATTYDARGRMLTSAQGAEVTTYAYTPNGQISSLALPSGYVASYTYDAAQRLIGIADNRGNTISYTLDAMGNRLREEVKDASGTIAALTTRAINTLNRVGATAGAAGQTTQFGYDANGEAISQTDPLNQITRQTLDPLRRPTATTLADNAVATQAWNPLDQLTQATDPKGIATQYSRNAFGDVMLEASPDAGPTSYTHDSAGNITSSTDARNQTTQITRDALGRPSLITFGAGQANSFTHALSYDSVGNLSQITDPSGSTTFTRDVLSRISQKTQTVADNAVNPSSYGVQYLYHPGGGIAQINYPSGLKVFYRKNASNQITQVDVQTPNNALSTLVNNISYTALQQPKSWVWRHCLNGSRSGCGSSSRTFDADGRMTANEFATYTFDAASRITSVTQSLKTSNATTPQTSVTWSAQYDNRNRLTNFARTGAASAYTYDANSNRLTAINTSLSNLDLEGTFALPNYSQTSNQTLNLPTASNRLLGFTQSQTTFDGTTAGATTSTTVNYSLDAAGNLTSDGLRSFEYDGQNRLSKVQLTQSPEAAKITYLHNALGQRVFKSEPQIAQTAPSATTLGTPFVNWLQTNFGWLFAAAQVNATLGQSYVYDDGQLGSTPVLLGEYGNGGTQSQGRSEYIWLPNGDGTAIPIALYNTNRLYAVHADHLNTPRLVTDDANKAVWQLPYSAFGDNKPTGVLQSTANAAVPGGFRLKATNPVINLNLRFPGQYFDEESNLSYNMNRLYQAGQGRYTQSDPIGLAGGWNRYQYAESNPLSNTDPLGLFGVVGAGFGAGIDLSIQAYKNYRDECDLFDLDNYDWWDVGVAAAVGAVAPGAISVGKTAWTSGNAAKNLSAQLTRARTPNRVAKLQGRLDAHTGAIIEAVATQGAWQGYQIVGKQLNGKGPRDCTCKR